MRIIALIKQVPGTDAVKMDAESGVMIRTGKDTVINPMDENALARAIEIKNNLADARISVLSMGPPNAKKALREAIACGADDGFLVCGREFAGSDTIATAKALAAAVDKIGHFDLLICGERATDGETGQTAAMLAHYLNIPVATYVSRIEVDVVRRTVNVMRTVEGGFEHIELPMPALVSVNKDIADPSFPTLAGKVRAKAVDIPTWSAKDIGVSEAMVGLNGSPTRVVKIFSPKLSRETQFDKYDKSSSINRLFSFLNSKDLLAGEDNV